MKMNEIRGEYGDDFIQKITSDFVNAFKSEIIYEDGLLEKISSVRSENHDPLFAEMLLALWMVFVDQSRKALLLHREAMDIDEVRFDLHEAEHILTDKIIAYLEDKPKQNAKKGAEALHNKPGGSREKRAKIRELWATGKYDSRDRCAEQEFAALGMSLSAARRALRNTPEPG
jgi:hypothetical protein